MKQLIAAIVILIVFCPGQPSAQTPTLQSYTAYPPFLNQTVPPLVMLVMSKSHRLFLKAYNDITDLDGDGVIDTTYKDTIAYDGYFDWTKCYTYNTTTSRFEPVAASAGMNGHYCSGNWSGNFLNWATMARIDVIRKVLYGGHRSVDTSTTTVLSRTLLPQDGHSWAKVYNGTDIPSLTPFSWSTITFCNTNTAGTQTSSLVYIKNGYFPYAASTENKQCLWQYNASSSSPYGPSLSPNYTYNTDVLVCVSGMLESTCQTYTDTGGTAHYKPTGLMQQLGVDRQGTATTSDDAIFMKFALISGSYGAHVSGGVLRSNIVDVNAEVDPATGMIASTSKIISNIDRFQIVQYSYSGGWYFGNATATSNVSGENCNQGEVLDLSTAGNGICRSWGNPIGEMLYEAIRYFMGKSGPTSQYQVSSPDNNLLNLTVDSPWTDPYGTCPYCSKPFVLLLSDPRPSYDSDQLPGSYWYSAISTADTPSVQTLIANANINSLEGIGNVYIGQSGSTFDRSCTPKTGDFSLMRGLCIEEPTKQGSFYLAGLANYGKTNDLRPDKQGAQNLTTYSVATDPPFPTLTFTVGSQQVQVIPAFHDGCPSTNWGSPGYSGCTGQGQNGDNSGGEIVDFQVCQNDADWTTEQTNGFTSCYDLMWDDADYGWDYELDVRYRIYVKTATGTITIKTKALYAAAGHTDYAGYFINGVVGSGQYLDVACGGVAGFSDCDVYNGITSGSDGMGNSVNTRTFSVTGSTTGVLNDPLWYAAKYGGFEDQDGSKTPNLQSEWDQNNDGVPDTYFYTANPLQLQAQLGLAFLSIISKADSGTAVSVLATSSTGDGSLYQAYFNPAIFDAATLSEVKWIGYTQGLFLDSFGNIREDTDHDGRLVYTNDYIVQTQYDSNVSSPTFGQVLVSKFIDANGDGKADSTTPTQSGLPLSNLAPIWEAGKQLALTAATARTLLTWVDTNNNGLVDPGEQIPFSTANDTLLAPYLRAGAAPYTADNIINFVSGAQVAGLRNRQLTVGGSPRIWKLGDVINSTPTIVGAPKERYDVIYGDATYSAFYQQYRNRRQVAYVGANDGMLHAFNAGFYNIGDDPTTPNAVEHGWFTTQRVPPLSSVTNTPPLGQELWGFIPYQLLPHLQWLTRLDYTHVYFVDLKPKVTDVRIFTPDADHPNGWGTILIGGFRMGGSCGACSSGAGAPPMVVNIGGTNRTFYSAYFVLDITNPEVPPKLLWSFADPGLGLTTGYPTVVRVSPSGDVSTDNTHAKWFVVFGSGPTGYDGSIVQTATMYAIDLSTGPGTGNALVTTMPVGTLNSWIGDFAALDKDLDFRTDAVYMGKVITNSTPAWRGKLYRLTTGGCTGPPCTPSTWGIASGSNRVPTEMLDTFPQSSAFVTGPITTAPTLTLDDGNKVWTFFGTGRYYNLTDRTNTDTQYFFGIKDSVVSGTCTQSSTTNCWNNNLVDVSAAVVCTVCTGNQVTGVTGVTSLLGTSTSTLQGLVATKDGWFTTLPTAGERVLVAPTLLGGIVYFTSFVPANDICSSGGTSYLYGLFYLTGSAYKDPILGTTTAGGNTVVNRSIQLGGGTGLASQVALQIVKQGTGTSGTTGTATGCQGGVMGFIQSSTGTLSQYCTRSAVPTTSRYISWLNQRH